MMLHLKALLKKAKKLPVRSMGSAYYVNNLKGRIMTMIEEGKYHERELREIEGRLNPKEKENKVFKKIVG